LEGIQKVAYLITGQKVDAIGEYGDKLLIERQIHMDLITGLKEGGDDE
jgi:hypothetical protein